MPAELGDQEREQFLTRMMNGYSELYFRTHGESPKLDRDAFSAVLQMAMIGGDGRGKRFLLSYEYTPEYLLVDNSLFYKRFNYAADSIERGELQISGSCLGQHPLTSLLIFRAKDREAVEAFAQNDPYVTANLVAKKHISEWTIDMAAFGLM